MGRQIPPILCLITISIIAFISFSIGSVLTKLQQSKRANTTTTTTTTTTTNDDSGRIEEAANFYISPLPVSKSCSAIPETHFTYKNYPVNGVKTSNFYNNNCDNLVLEDYNEQWVTVAASDTTSKTSENETKTNDDNDEDPHYPAGQHLLVDIKHVDNVFLADELALSKAMIDTVKESGLTLLSYHCHELFPSGISCVGILLESHISLHTWPEFGVISLDVFTCGEASLLPVVPLIERLFAIPNKLETKEPQTLWSHYHRGFRADGSTHPLESDLGKYLLQVQDVDYKKEIVSTQTPFQRIDVYDVIEPRFNSLVNYHASLGDDTTDYRVQHPEFFKPKRVIFLDGVIQSDSLGDEPYHEMLVHPGMFAHKNPRRVAIIGGGEGATLREVLKHKTLDRVYMIEIDEMMVEVSKEHIPFWSDCSDIVGSTPSCFDDPRAQINFEDAMSWMIDRYLHLDVLNKPYADDDDRFDLIIMDALDPQDTVPFAEVLYNTPDFYTALDNAMTENGILIIQTGFAPEVNDPPQQYGNHKNRQVVIDTLLDKGYSLYFFNESHGGFYWPWSFLAACKGECKWTGSTIPEITYKIYQRIKETRSGESPLKYFDGAIMQTLKSIPKEFEYMYCVGSVEGDCVGRFGESSRSRDKYDPFHQRRVGVM